MSTWAVVLAGGVGSRFWPLSTPTRPKQLLPLISDEPLLAESVARLHPLINVQHVLILTNAGLVDPITALLPAIPGGNVIAEPKPSGTAAALAWAAKEIVARDGPEAIMVSVHADWAVGDAAGFRATLAQAIEVATARHVLVTVGVVPSRLDAGFGYIAPGEPLDPGAADGVRRVARFVEKPDLARARAMTETGSLWNSGIFVWRAGDFLDEIRALTPEIAPSLAAHAGDIDAFFQSVTPIAVDVGVLERSNRVVVLSGNFGWDDVGTWGRLRGVRPHDAQGNASTGDVYAVEATGNVVHAAGPTVVVYGVSDLVVVAEKWIGAGDDGGAVWRSQVARRAIACSRGRTHMRAMHRERPALYLYDDAIARRFEPFALTRPVSTLVAGALPIWSRWQVAMQAPLAGLCCGPHLANYRDIDTPGATTGIIPRGMIVANARFVPAGDVVPWRGFRGVAPPGRRSLDADANVWTNDGRVVAVRLPHDVDADMFEGGELALESLAAEGPSAPMSGWWHDEVWDFIRNLGEQLTNDILRALVEPPEISLWTRVASWAPPAHSTTIGEHPIIVHGQDTRSPVIRPAEIEP